MRLLPDGVRYRFASMTPGRQRWLVTGAFLLLQVLIWVFLELIYYSARPITDTSIYYMYANRIVDYRMFPYEDFSAEYPPVAILVFLLPRLLSGLSYNMYVYWFEAEMLLFGWANILLVSLLAWRRWGDSGRLAATLGLYSLFSLMIGFIIASRFDLVASFLILATVAAFIYDRKVTAWALIGVGVMTKVVPLLIAPLLLIAHSRQRQKGWLFIGPAIALSAAAAIALPFAAASWEGLIRAFVYHAERPLQIESSWAMPLLYVSYLGYGLHTFLSYGSHNLFTPLANLLAALSGPVTLLFLVLCYWTFARRFTRRDIDQGDGHFEDQLVRYAAAVIVVFIAGGKVLSPQFLIWLLPLIPLVYDPDRRYILTLFGAILVTTQLEFPFYYGELLALNPLVVTLVAVRNALVIWLAVVLVRRPLPRGGLFGLHRLAAG